MSPPRHLDTTLCPYEWHQHIGLTDVESGGVGIITDLRLYLVTNRGWTEPSTNLFQCPADAFGRWIDVLLTRIDAATLECRLRDQNGHVIGTRRVLIDVAGTTVTYWAAKFFMTIETERAQPEQMMCFLLEESPESDGDVLIGAALLNGYRNNASTVDGQGTLDGGILWENTAAVSQPNRIAESVRDVAGNVVGRISGGGSLLYEDAKYWITVISGDQRYTGRLWHAYLGDSSLANGTTKSLEVDDAVTATFWVMGMLSVQGTKMMLRKSDP